MQVRTNDDCFVLGSGASLLSLKEKEIADINRAKFILSFNKYLIFYKLVGIVPTHYLLGDDRGLKSNIMIRETVKVCQREGLDSLRFILSRSYQVGTPEHKLRLEHLKTLPGCKDSDIAEEV